MPPRDLADDLGLGLVKRWIKSREPLTAEDAIGLLNEFSAADPELWESMVDLVYSGLDDQEVDRLRKMLDVAIVRRRGHTLGAEG
jgi:hypothetical protein